MSAEDFVTKNLPTGIMFLVGFGVIWAKVNNLDKTVSELTKTCKNRLKWCIDHFQPKP